MSPDDVFPPILDQHLHIFTELRRVDRYSVSVLLGRSRRLPQFGLKHLFLLFIVYESILLALAIVFPSIVVTPVSMVPLRLELLVIDDTFLLDEGRPIIKVWLKRTSLGETKRVSCHHGASADGGHLVAPRHARGPRTVDDVADESGTHSLSRSSAILNIMHMNSLTVASPLPPPDS